MKKLFWIGLIVAIAGGIAFAVITKPWEKFQSLQKQEKKIEASYAAEYTPKKPVEKQNVIIPSTAPVDNLSLAKKLLASGLYRESITALNKYKEANVANAESTEVLEVLKSAYMGMQNFLEAEKIVKKLLQQSNTPVNQLGLVEVLLLSGKVSDAQNILTSVPRSLEKTYYELVIAIFNEDTPSIKTLAAELEKSTNQKYKTVGENVLGVYKTYDSFRDGSPHYLRMMMANILNILKYHTLVTQFVRPTLEQYDDYRDAWILAGNAYLNLKKFRQAEQMLEKAVSLDPSHPKSPYYLGIALAEQGQLENAVGQFENAIANNYQPVSEVERYVGDLYFRQKKFDEAFNHYQVVLDSQEVKIEDYSKSLYIVLEEQKSPELGLKMASQAVKKFPNEARSYALLSWALVKAKNYTQAFTAIEKGRKKNINLPDFSLYLGQMYEDQGQKNQALESYKDCFEKADGGVLSQECAKRYNSLREEE